MGYIPHMSLGKEHVKLLRDWAYFSNLVAPVGLEPTTRDLVGSSSSHLSYGAPKEGPLDDPNGPFGCLRTYGSLTNTKFLTIAISGQDLM